MVKFLTGKDYPHLCKYCQESVDLMAEHLRDFGEDTDNTEAPIIKAYDYDMLCGGNFCENKEEK